MSRIYVVATMLLLVFGCGRSGNDLSDTMVASAFEQLSPCASVQVKGTTQIPNANAAKVDVQITEMSYKDSASGRSVESYTGPATATFRKYDDGSWVLSEVGVGPKTFANLQVSAKPLPPPAVSPTQTTQTFIALFKDG